MSSVTVPAPIPFRGILNNTSPDHIQVDILHAIPQVAPAINHRAPVPALPESTPTPLADVVVLSELTFELLHEASDGLYLRGDDQHMHVIGCDAIGKHAELELLYRCAKSIPVFRAITREAEEEAAIVTTMGKMTGAAR